MAEVTVTTAWRSSFLDGVTLDLGPGQGSAFVSVSSWDILGTVVDANGESYTLVSRTLTHDFGTVGDYVISFSSCCRISTLVNAADENFRVEATVRLGNDTNGPRASLPAIMQMAAGVPNSIDINSFISGKSHVQLYRPKSLDAFPFLLTSTFLRVLHRCTSLILSYKEARKKYFLKTFVCLLFCVYFRLTRIPTLA